MSNEGKLRYHSVEKEENASGKEEASTEKESDKEEVATEKDFGKEEVPKEDPLPATRKSDRKPKPMPSKDLPCELPMSTNMGMKFIL